MSTTANHNNRQHIVIDIGSRKKPEFERRTAIFEGAYRAWSYLGGRDPTDLVGSSAKTAAELEDLLLHHPVTTSGANPHRHNHSRVGSGSYYGSKPEIVYPFQSLPRNGLSHPFVQAIISPWLGPHADLDVRKRGLDTLRIWWQHRKGGPSRTALSMAHKMSYIVDGYTRLFFRFVHCLVVHEQALPPPTLYAKMKEHLNHSTTPNNNKEQAVEEEEYDLDAVQADISNPDLSPLEKLHMVQRRLRASSTATGATSVRSGPATLLQNLRDKKCVPGPIDFLPAMVAAIDRHNRETAAGTRAGPGTVTPETVASSSNSSSDDVGGGTGMMVRQQQQPPPRPTQLYGYHHNPNPHPTPVVYCSSSGDTMIVLTVDGIVCGHCVKIVETVLCGCNSGNGSNSRSSSSSNNNDHNNNKNKSPIAGLVDAVADHRDIISTVLIKIDQARHAPRIAMAAVRNLRLVGYEAVAKTMSDTVVVGGTEQASMLSGGSGDGGGGGGGDDSFIATAFEAVATSTTTNESHFSFDWTAPCTCPAHGTFFVRDDCPRHSQMDHARILDAFSAREHQVCEYLQTASGLATGASPTQPGRMDDRPILPNSGGPNQAYLGETELSSELVSPPPLVANQPFLGELVEQQQQQQDQQQDQNFPQPPPLQRPICMSSRDLSMSLYSIGTSTSNCRLRRRSVCRPSTATISMSGLFDMDWENLQDDDDDLHP